MTTSISAAMRVLERGDVAAAEPLFASIAGTSRTGVIARFRRAECLSRLGRHDEAVLEARAAFRDGGDESAPWVWLVHCLAEAGRTEEIGTIEIPAHHTEELVPMRAGYAALGRIAAGDRSDAAKTVDAILDTRHAPLYSLALRLAEAARLAKEPRWPDLPSTWYAHECRLEMKAEKLTEHPAIPPAAPAAKAARWLRMHWSCADYAGLVTELRAAKKPPADLDECELEQHLAFGRIDAAAALAEKLVAAAGKDAAGELCVDLARIAQLRGEAVCPSKFPGFEDARKRLAPTVAWLDLVAEILTNRPLAARPLADRVADPSHREFVEAALVRWREGKA